MRTTYRKLIRDRIPEILEAEGLRYEVAELDEAGFRSALLAKLLEEAAEIGGARDADEMMKELAGLFEVIDAVLDLPIKGRESAASLVVRHAVAGASPAAPLASLSSPATTSP